MYVSFKLFLKFNHQIIKQRIFFFCFNLQIHKQDLFSMISKYSELNINYQMNNQHKKSKSKASEPVDYKLRDFDDYNDDSALEQDSDSNHEPVFQSKNQLYELRSRCNQLEYMKAKMIMSHENAIKQWKQKCIHLQKIVTDLRRENQILIEQKQRLVYALEQLRQTNLQFKKEISSLKVQMQNIFEKNRLTPNFNNSVHQDLSGQSEIIVMMIQKDKIIENLNKQLTQIKHDLRGSTESFGTKQNKVFEDLKQQNNKLIEQNARLNSKISLAKSQQAQSLSFEENGKTLSSIQEKYKTELKNKDKIIEQSKKRSNELQLNNQSLRQKITMLEIKLQNKAKSARQEEITKQQLKKMNDQLSNKDKKIKLIQHQKSQLENQLKKLQIEVSKLRSHINKLQQFNKYLEATSNDYEQKKKTLQDDLNQAEKQIAEQKTELFNEKISNKKLISNIKNQLETQKLRYHEALEEKNQEIKKLRSSAFNHTNDSAKNIEIQQLKYQNNRLKTQYHLMKQNYGKKIDQYDIKQEETKNQYQKRIKILQNEIYKLQLQNSQYLLKIGKNNRQDDRTKSNQQKQHLKDIIELLKIEKQQLSDSIKQFKQEASMKDEKQKQNAQIIKNLQEQIRNLKDDNKNLEIINQQLNQKFNSISEIETQIRKMNEDMQKQKIANQMSKRDRIQHSHTQIQELVKILEQTRKQNYEMKITLTNYQNQISKKNIQISINQQQMTALKNEIKDTKSPNNQVFHQALDAAKKSQFNAVSLENKIIQLQRQVDTIRKSRQSELEDYRTKIRKQIQTKYENQINRLKQYSRQLEKNINLINQRNSEDSFGKNELTNRIQMLEKQNYTLKYDYSEALQQINNLLIKYQALEGNIKKSQLQFQTKSSNDFNSLRESYSIISKENEENKILLSNANTQIRKLNEVLMLKQAQMKQKIYRCSHHHDNLNFDQRDMQRLTQEQSFIKEITSNRHYFSSNREDLDSYSQKSKISKSPNPIDLVNYQKITTSTNIYKI